MPTDLNPIKADIGRRRWDMTHDYGWMKEFKPRRSGEGFAAWMTAAILVAGCAALFVA